MKRLLLLSTFVLLSACASLPQKTLTTLNMDDPKYNSEGCKNIRNSALSYDDKTTSRAGLGLATGLLLGPIGIIPSAIADASQNNKRDLINQEITRQCVTTGFTSTTTLTKNESTSDKKECKNVNGSIKCE